METFHLMPRVTVKDNEGNTYAAYSAPIAVKGESWPAGGKVQAATYGERLPYVRNVKIAGNYEARKPSLIRYKENIILNGGIRVVMPDGANVVFYSTVKLSTEGGNVEYVFEDGTVIREKDGICIDVLQPDPAEEGGEVGALPYLPPDYEIISITPHKPLILQAMRR